MIYQQQKRITTTEKLFLNWLPAAGTVAMVFSYVTQIWITYSTKNVIGQSLAFWFVLSFALLTMVLQQIGLIRFKGVKSYTGLVFQSLNLILAVVMLVGVLLFR